MSSSSSSYYTQTPNRRSKSKPPKQQYHLKTLISSSGPTASPPLYPPISPPSTKLHSGAACPSEKCSSSPEPKHSSFISTSWPPTSKHGSSSTHGKPLSTLQAPLRFSLRRSSRSRRWRPWGSVLGACVPVWWSLSYRVFFEVVVVVLTDGRFRVHGGEDPVYDRSCGCTECLCDLAEREDGGIWGRVCGWRSESVDRFDRRCGCWL